MDFSNITFPPDYEIALTQKRLSANWPNLQLGENFVFKSPKDRQYNCVAWALHINNDWVERDYTDNGDLQDPPLEHYVNLFKEKGFDICDDGTFETGVEKICLYGDKFNLFGHVCRQMTDGIWASKLGFYEDIYHKDLKCIAGDYYGVPTIFMKREKKD